MYSNGKIVTILLLATCFLFSVQATVLAQRTGEVQSKCGSLSTQMDMNVCYENERQLADRKLSRIYQQLIKAISNPNVVKTLQEAERAWISYRDKDCEFRAAGVRGGTVYPMIAAICHTEKIRARTEELRRILECPESDLSCPR